ncbi:hypothetical protein BSKO_08072 [Bryopsis sp. KO-2023]|nr:hypothetical protein BSKO_08072 [Bryopsis sp. KO-2023]
MEAVPSREAPVSQNGNAASAAPAGATSGSERNRQPQPACLDSRQESTQHAEQQQKGQNFEEKATDVATTREGDVHGVKKEEDASGWKGDEPLPSGSSKDVKVENTEAKTEGDVPEEDPDELLKEFYAEVREVDRNQEVERILAAFKLNPFEQLNLRMDTTIEEVRRQYRKLSLMVHPDKCHHERAREAFEVLGEAQKFLLDDEKKVQLIFGMDTAREEVRKERKKATKHNNVVRVASMIHEEGRAGVEAEYEKSEDFHVKWMAKAREILAKTEWRKRKLAKRLREEEDRIEVEEKEDREFAKRKKEHEDNWEKSRETRVGTWRDYMNNKKGGKKRKKSKSHGELRPPKIKTNDEDKLYVQRPIGEQFRPPQKKR